MFYPAVPSQILTGAEALHSGASPTGHTVLDFWRWSSSNLANNATRGILAEYIVASALGITSQPRVEWDAYDLVTSEGVKVEVKSAAYLQAWAHAKLSSIRFSIPQTLGWSSETNAYDAEKRRQADIYVFCLLHHQEKATLDPLNLDQWTFYIVGSALLNSKFPNSSTLSLRSLLKLGVVAVSYAEISEKVRSEAPH